jgi:hypothetical protein
MHRNVLAYPFPGLPLFQDSYGMVKLISHDQSSTGKLENISGKVEPCFVAILKATGPLSG